MSDAKDEILYRYAMSFVGKPYKWGGSNPMDGFDCSGLVVELLQSVGILPHKHDATSQGLHDYMLNTGKGITYAGFMEFGNLLFFGKSATEINHIGFALDSNRMLEAGGGGRSTTDIGKAAKVDAFVRIRPIKIRSDLVAVIKPFY